MATLEVVFRSMHSVATKRSFDSEKLQKALCGCTAGGNKITRCRYCTSSRMWKRLAVRTSRVKKNPTKYSDVSIWKLIWTVRAQLAHEAAQ